MRPPELHTRGSLPALANRREPSSCAGATRRFMLALGRCHGSKAHRRCAAYLAEKLEPSGVIRLTIGRAAARSSGWLEFFSKIGGAPAMGLAPMASTEGVHKPPSPPA